MNTHVVAKVDKLHEANRVIHNHDQVVNDEGADDTDHDVADEQVLLHVMDEATKANECADQEVDADLIDEVLPIDQIVLPLGLDNQKHQHKQARPHQQKHYRAP